MKQPQHYKHSNNIDLSIQVRDKVLIQYHIFSLTVTCQATIIAQPLKFDTCD